MDSREIFAGRIDDLIEKSRKTQNAIAEAMGVSPTAISDYRNGKREPGAYVLKKLADYFNVSLDYLAGKEECPTPENEEIRKLTGLSDSAINALKGMNQPGEVAGEVLKLINGPAISAVNTLLSSEEGIDLLEAIANYLSGNYNEPYVLTHDGERFAWGERERINVRKVLVDTEYQTIGISAEILSESVLSIISTRLRRMKEAKDNVDPEDSK